MFNIKYNVHNFLKKNNFLQKIYSIIAILKYEKKYKVSNLRFPKL